MIQLLYMIAKCKSFRYIKNRRGPKTEPCGTPCLICSVSESFPCIVTYWVLLDR